MGNQIIITKYYDSIVTCLHDGKSAVQFNVDPECTNQILGNVYIGKVKNIISNINAAFVEIADGKMCYLSLAEVKNPVFIHHGQSKTICVGDELIVQVARDEVKTKAPVVTTSFALTGKYVVLTHGKPSLGVSNKIEEEEEQKRLRKIVKPFVADNYGFIVRTNSLHANADLIQNEVNHLIMLYQDILMTGIHRTCFSMLYQTLPPFLCTIRDGFADNIDAIRTDEPELYLSIEAYLSDFQKEDLEKLKMQESSALPLNVLYKIPALLEEALREKVWLRSGGSVIIQPTEALTVIDVNTEKAISSKKKVQDMFLKINLEATDEIARQIRLRNLSGIIIIDYIDMIEPKYKEELIEHLQTLLFADPIKTTFVDMTALNLVELTRKKVRRPLYEQVPKNLIKTQINI